MSSIRARGRFGGAQSLISIVLLVLLAACTFGLFASNPSWAAPATGNQPTSDSSDELNPTCYTSTSYVYWDTFTATSYDTNGYVSGGAVDTSSRSNIQSVTLAGNAVAFAESNTTSGLGSVSGQLPLSTYFPNASASLTSSDTSTMESATLVITPADGYYVTNVVIACTSMGTTVPYSCETWSAENAFSESFSVDTSGSTSVSVSSLDFSHRSESPYYFVLIEIAPIPSPLYVQYSYGNITSFIDISQTVFAISNTWTNVSLSNYYGDGLHDTLDGEPGIKTADTQLKYSYDAQDDDGGASDAARWVHVANSITDEAHDAAAAAGMYFVGWQARYYGSVDVTEASSGSDNYVYQFNNAFAEGSTLYQEGDSVKLTSHVILTAQWAPMTLTVEKQVTGLSGTEFANESVDYTLMVQVYDEASSAWVDYQEVTITVSGDSSSTAYLEYVPAGTYRAIEKSDSVLTGTSASYTATASESSSIVVSESNPDASCSVVNTYTEKSNESSDPDPDPSPDPEDPEDPEDPANPDPEDPEDPANPDPDPDDPEDPANPDPDPDDPDDPEDPTDPVDPVDPIDPDPIDPVEPVIDPSDPSDTSSSSNSTNDENTTTSTTSSLPKTGDAVATACSVLILVASFAAVLSLISHRRREGAHATATPRVRHHARKR